MDRHDHQVLAALEQELLAPAVRRLRRRFWIGTATLVAATVAGLALAGPAALPVLYVVLLTGGLALVARTTESPARPAVQPRHATPRPGRQPLGCSTKS
ncbi:hypothetical protein [Blastococcus sp. URHD0036]|uniref:hypothetical protein n=1 Tax=Blastococcus sp. URHD0036 TaxID=1380356 RepID=UPI00049509E1|nr:hypothetical protein [Blastococcus sp. URHD0036]